MLKNRNLCYKSKCLSKTEICLRSKFCSEIKIYHKINILFTIRIWIKNEILRPIIEVQNNFDSISVLKKKLNFRQQPKFWLKINNFATLPPSGD